MLHYATDLRVPAHRLAPRRQLGSKPSTTLLSEPAYNLMRCERTADSVKARSTTRIGSGQKQSDPL